MGFEKISNLFLMQIIAVSLIGILSGIDYGHATVRDPQTIIQDLNTQLEAETNQVNRAKLYCYRARQQVILRNFKAAENDYLLSLGQDMNGWVMNEFGHFLYRDGQFEKAYNLASNLEKQFPGFQEDARKLSKKAKAKYHEEYLKQHPPTITINTTPNYGYKSRRQLIEEVKAREATQRREAVARASDYCVELAGAGGSYSYTVEKECRRMEAEARNDVNNLRVPPEIDKYCNELAGAGGSYSYTVMEECIRMESSAKRSLGR